MFKSLFLLVIFFSCLISCQQKVANHRGEETPKELSDSPHDTTEFEESFEKFIPDSISNVKIKDFDIDYAYKIGSSKIIIGYFRPVNGVIPLPDTEEDWGDRLMMLNVKNEIVFKSAGVGDVYLFEPHFYKNKKNGKVIVVCQKAYEYFFGGEAFLIENGIMEYIGNIDVDGEPEETNLIDILKITELNNRIVFSFSGDFVTYKPGNNDILLKNNNVRYVYENKVLSFKK